MDRLVLLTLVSLGITACGLAQAPSGSDRPAAAQASSPEALVAIKGATAGSLSDSATLSVTLTGATVFGGSSSLAGSGSFDFRSLNGALSLTPANSRSTQSVVYAPDAVYIRPLAERGVLPPGRHWVRAGFTDAKAVETNFPEFIAEAESLNPALSLDQILWGATSAAAAGEDALNGQMAVRYDVTVDLNRALLNASGTARTPFAQVLQSEIRGPEGSSAPATQATRTTITLRAWLSRAGRLLRVAFEPPGIGVGTVTTTLSGFGTSTPAELPPADQVVDVRSIGPLAERENKNGGDSDGG
jgi:predicted small lipoprotein YifL